MRSAAADQPTPDLTARATIRNTALRLFADHGPDAVSIRRIAADAGVSPALVLHHFGSKAGLRAAVDAHAASAFDAVLAAGGEEDLADAMTAGDSSSLAAAFAEVFPADSPLPAYLRRLLLSGDPAGTALFGQWLDATEQLLAALAEAGIDYDDVIATLEQEGVDKFVKSWDELVETVRGQMDAAK